MLQHMPLTFAWHCHFERMMASVAVQSYLLLHTPVPTFLSRELELLSHLFTQSIFFNQRGFS